VCGGAAGVKGLGDERGLCHRIDRRWVARVGRDGSGVFVASHFTLPPSTRKGTKPSWHRAAGPEVAGPLYEAFVRKTEELLGRAVATGEFGAMMEVVLANDGPVTLVLDSRLRE